MVFSILAFLTLFISMGIRDRNKSLKVQTLNCLFKGLYDLTISAYTGAVLDLVNFIRSLLFVNKDKFSKTIYLSLYNFLKVDLKVIPLQLHKAK